MKIEDMKINMRVRDGWRHGVVLRIYKKTVHICFFETYEGTRTLIYDSAHLQFLREVK